VAAFNGATLCGINDPRRSREHGYAVRLFSVCEIFQLNFTENIKNNLKTLDKNRIFIIIE
jgi:hypothetical protein